ncbi:hypothetical protein ACA29_03645 [Lederbergia galactosidilytica]|uniref:Uncharacterized protein n=1 Tax=Lederbergia galactosidilytica TaxID=217031 RepID=A0A0Q9Y762_9BACI|nr:alpha/beta hydrolase [Lederbergia galactosidilytica]KRG16720.1 hypothetical protein ACA29_03645 [Lederbergia galactosidilytica]
MVNIPTRGSLVFSGLYKLWFVVKRKICSVKSESWSYMYDDAKNTDEIGLVEIHNASHCSNQDNPLEFNDALIRFLKE